MTAADITVKAMLAWFDSVQRCSEGHAPPARKSRTSADQSSITRSSHVRSRSGSSFCARAASPTWLEMVRTPRSADTPKTAEMMVSKPTLAMSHAAPISSRE